VKNRVFETLDTVNRRWHLSGLGDVILTDTVGFIRDLPKDLMAAFQTTLQELQEADVLLHVIDAHVPDPGQHITAVENILSELGLETIPWLRFFNKADLVGEKDIQLLCQRYRGISGSALQGASLQMIQRELRSLLRGLQVEGVWNRKTQGLAHHQNMAPAGIIP